MIFFKDEFAKFVTIAILIENFVFIVDGIMGDLSRHHNDLYNYMVQGLICIDRDGLVLDANNSALQLLGLTTKEIGDVRIDEERWRMIRQDGTVVSNNKSLFFVSLGKNKKIQKVLGIFNRKNNKFFWSKISAVPYELNENGESEKVLMVLDDVSDILKSEERLISNELENENQTILLKEELKRKITDSLKLSNFNRAIIKHMGMALISTTTEGIIESFNPEAEKLLCYGAEEVIGKLTPEVFLKKDEVGGRALLIGDIKGTDLSSSVDLFIKVCNFNKGDPSEWTFITKSRHEIPVLASVTSMYNQEGETIGYIFVALDISSEKRILEELRKSEERFRKLFYDNSEIMLIVNPVTYDIVDANSEAFNYFGRVLKGKKIYEISLTSEEKIRGWISETSQGMKNWLTTSHILPSGELRNIEAYSCQIDFGEHFFLFLIIHDTTERNRTKAILEKDEILLNLVSDTAPHGLLVVDNLRDILLYTNDTLIRMWNLGGMLLDQKNMSVSGIFRSIALLSDNPDILLRSFESLSNPDSDEPVEDEIITVDKRVIKRYSTVINNDKSHYYGRYYLFEDVTKERQRELRLRTIYKALKSFSIAIMIADSEAKIVWINSAFLKLSGYSLEEVMGANLFKLDSDCTDADYIRKREVTVYSGKLWKGEVSKRRKDGSLFYEEETICPVTSRYGNIESFIGMRVDTTKRRLLEDDLRISKTKLQIAFDGTSDGLWELDIKKYMISFTGKLTDKLGVCCENKSISLNDYFSYFFPEDVEKFLILVRQHLNGESEYYENEHRFICPDGSIIWILAKGKAVQLDSSYKPTSIVGGYIDMTERKKNEEILEGNLTKEKNLKELRTRFISSTSHEFRTPLASILIGVDSILNYHDRLSESQKIEKLRKIKSQVLNLSSIVEKVLQISRVEERRIELDLEYVDVAGLCRQVIENFSVDPDLKRRIGFSCEDESLAIFLDRRLMIQIMNNLISNAIRYSFPDPQVDVSIFEKSGDVIIEVKDNGIGIPEDDKVNLFNPFFRARNTKQTSGYGLGLCLVKESIELLEGKIDFHSVENIGTRFFIRLPGKLIYKETTD